MADPHAAIEMDCRHQIITGDYTCSYSYAYRSIIGSGTITRLETDDDKRYALGKLMEHMAPAAALEFSPRCSEEQLYTGLMSCILQEKNAGRKQNNKEKNIKEKKKWYIIS